jgi:hypothetical protein
LLLLPLTAAANNHVPVMYAVAGATVARGASTGMMYFLNTPWQLDYGYAACWHCFALQLLLVSD